MFFLNLKKRSVKISLFPVKIKVLLIFYKVLKKKMKIKIQIFKKKSTINKLKAIDPNQITQIFLKNLMRKIKLKYKIRQIILFKNQ